MVMTSQVSGRPSTPTASDVAALAGVSVATVSRFVNGKRIRNEEIVRKAMQELGFRLHEAGRGRRPGRTDTIALVGPDATYPLLTSALRAIETAMEGTRFRVIFYRSEPGQIERTVSDLAGRVDGVIVSPTDRADPTPSALVDGGLQVVLLNSEVDGAERFDRVPTDNYGGSRLAVDYLVRLGHRNIAAVTNVTGSVGPDRERGFRDGLEHHGIELRSEYLADYDLPVQSSRQAGYTKMLRLLTLPDPPTAIFSAGLLLTTGALRAMKDVELSMPRDVSFVSFDDHELFDIFPPGITVVSRSVEDQARHAARLLLERLGGDGPEERQRVLIGTELLVRGSCSPV